MKMFDPESRKIIFLPLINLLVLESVSVNVFGVDPIDLAFAFMIFSAVARATGEDLEIDPDVSMREEEVLRETGKLLSFSLDKIVMLFAVLVVLVISAVSLFLAIKNVHLVQNSVYRLVGLSAIFFQIYFWTEIIWDAILAVSTAINIGKEESFDKIRSS